MKIWLDNEKPAPKGWVWVRTQVEVESIFNQFVGHVIISGNPDNTMISVEEVTHLSLDYELDPGCGDGLGVAKCILKGARTWRDSIKTSRDANDIQFLGIQPICVTVHSFSKSAKKEMIAILVHAEEMWVEGLRELSTIALANQLDAAKGKK